MQAVFKRGASGFMYITIMWFGVSYSEFSYRILFSILAIISLYEMWELRRGKKKIIAFSYIIIPFILIQLFDLTNNHSRNTFDSSIILFMFTLTWTFDTFAYVIGSKFGKNKILPSISPKKSWEGFFGGFIFSIIAAYISSKYLIENNIKLVIIISILLPFTATLGDFIESKYKREKGVKDSGNLIPGHGGILDRMDAFMITIPTIYIIENIIL